MATCFTALEARAIFLLCSLARDGPPRAYLKVCGPPGLSMRGRGAHALCAQALLEHVATTLHFATPQHLVEYHMPAIVALYVNQLLMPTSRATLN